MCFIHQQNHMRLFILSVTCKQQFCLFMNLEQLLEEEYVVTDNFLVKNHQKKLILYCEFENKFRLMNINHHF